MLKSQCLESHIEVMKNFIANGKIELLIDPRQMRQALANILINAIEAMPQGGELWVGTEKTADALRIVIKDSGIGIHLKDIPQIFDPFFSRKRDHTGLGLSITQGIVANHKGKLRVISEVNVGTEFIIELPLN